MIDAILNDGVDVASAVAMPRWELSPGSDPDCLSEPYEIQVDPRLDEKLLDGLRRRGHRIADKALQAVGAAQLISIDNSGAVQAAADPRADGLAIVLN
jgi:gamma-glutamyltranspeptidase/glutathione hydrolase